MSLTCHWLGPTPVLPAPPQTCTDCTVQRTKHKADQAKVRQQLLQLMPRHVLSPGMLRALTNLAAVMALIPRVKLATMLMLV